MNSCVVWFSVRENFRHGKMKFGARNLRERERESERERERERERRRDSFFFLSFLICVCVCVSGGLWANVCLCLDLFEGLCVCIFLRSPKAVVSDTCCWSFFPHLWAPMGDPFTPPKLSKEVINVSYSDDIHGTNKTGSHWNPAFLPFMVLFQPCVFLVIFPPFLHGHGRPHDPTKT